ncbi:MAG: alpha/beta hydrolase family esterase [Planctomycetota bacterium]|jgi:polyhydroxybutyrate depolymerase
MMHLLATLAILLVADGSHLSPGDSFRRLKVDGSERSYLVHVPPQYVKDTPTPVVLAFHGGGANARNMVAFSGLNQKADQSGFIVVYPDGSGRLERMLTFNAGNCCGQAAARNVDDVAFVRHILDDLEGIANVDRNRVFAKGMSNAAMMAYRVASEMSDRIAAIAPVSGPMGTKDYRPGRAVSVMHFHGQADEFAPFSGGKGRGPSGTEFYCVDHSISAWVDANGCNKSPRVTQLPDREKDGTTVKQVRYESGKEGAEVVLVIIEGGGHTWPGIEPRMQSLGVSTRDISANDMMWEFFQQHPMQ